MSDSLFSTESLIGWLEKKYSRHGEIEDSMAAARLHTLTTEVSDLRESLAVYEQDGGERVNAVVAECIRIGAQRAIIENERLIAEGSAKDRVIEDATSLCAWVQRELEQHDGWHQFDFLPVKFDLFWFCQLQKSLAAVSGRQKRPTCEIPENEIHCIHCGLTWDMHIAGSSWCPQKPTADSRQESDK